MSEKATEKAAPKFSKLVYKSPGPFHGGGSKTYDNELAESPEEYDKLLKDGWSKTPEDAYEALKGEPKPDPKSGRK
jgi:hypothetical protein